MRSKRCAVQNQGITLKGQVPPQSGDFVCLQTFLIFNFPALGHGLISVTIKRLALENHQGKCNKTCSPLATSIQRPGH